MQRASAQHDAMPAIISKAVAVVIVNDSGSNNGNDSGSGSGSGSSGGNGSISSTKSIVYLNYIFFLL